ncbi:hypothetical protein E8E13_003436 [Curvularia kusanoi]|uniref:Uncharacterized protein n=1 Tax=Curvularia kusanoi TaxID=90978 RepID=A0A9P4T5H3_CURKU|nr:hypothetical protein E8E13_003436 [Curvularia kusanoi]
MPRLSQLTPFLSLAALGFAQTGDIPFQVTGSLDSCSAGANYNSGGTIKINGFTVVVPDNLIVSYPTTYSPFPKLCGTNAVGDKYETTVVGNIVGDEIRAGQISVAARFGLEGSQGYIDSIGPDGSLQIKNGPKVIINDPEGAFAPIVPGSPALDQFVIDTENPSVTSFSGFPMCVKHEGNKATCLDENRPNGQSSYDAPKPLAMAPFKAGDYIEYSGIPSNGAIMAHTVNCVNVHVTTKASSTVPNYIRVEEMLVGIVDPAGNLENAPMRAVGYLSSCANALVTLSAIDVDPCTGVETIRRIDSTSPKAELRCKWELRVTSKTPFTRDYLVTTNTPVTTTDNGIKAGQYVAPVTEWIFPEVNQPGTFPPAYIFSDIQSLHQGDVLDDQQFGPLKPFPASSAPAAKKACSPGDIIKSSPTPTPSPDATTPAATSAAAADPAAPNSTPQGPLPVAAAQQFTAPQRVSALLTLTGSNTEKSYTNDQLNFVWTQTSQDPASPAVSVTIPSPSAATATFTAPKVTVDTTFTFTLTVSVKTNPSAKSTITVPIKISPNANDIVTMDSYTWSSSKSGTVRVACTSTVKNVAGENQGMVLLINQNTGTGTGGTRFPMAISQGQWAYSGAGTGRQPTNVQCISTFGTNPAKDAGKSIVRTAVTTRRVRRGGLGL